MPERDDKNWQVAWNLKGVQMNHGLVDSEVIFKDEQANLKMEYLASKFIPGGASYRARAVMEMPLAAEDAS